MSTLTPNYSFILPGVNDPTDQDLWGGYLNANWSSIDTTLKSVSDAVTDISVLTTKGDLLSRDGSDYVRVPVGANGKFLTADSTQDSGLAWGDVGRLMQSYYTSLSDLRSITTVIPLDNSIPQSSEGTEILSQAITPTDADNKIKITCSILCGGSIDLYGIAAIFEDGVSDALAASCTICQGGRMAIISMQYEEAAGSTDARTYSLKVGPNGGTLYINGTGAQRFFGGVANTTMVVQEIRV